MQKALNRLLQENTFPESSKTLIPYRPICLLNTIGKLYERVTVNKHNKVLQENKAYEITSTVLEVGNPAYRPREI